MNKILSSLLFLLSFNGLSMEPAEQPKDWELLGRLEKEQFDPYSIYLIGEHHGIKATYDVELALVKYFNQTQGVRHIFWESGYCTAELINLYLKTGNTIYIEEILKQLKGTFSYSQNYYNFLQEIYRYNLTLPENKRMEFVGVDVEHQRRTGMYYLCQLLRAAPVPFEIAESVKYIQTSKAYSDEFINEVFWSIHANFMEFKGAYQSYLGDNFDSFSQAIESIAQGRIYRSTNDAHAQAKRENFLRENFFAAIEARNPSKCLGFFGGLHTTLDMEEWALWAEEIFQHKFNGCNMAGGLDAGLLEKGRIANIELCYHNCSFLNKAGQSEKELHEKSACGKILAAKAQKDIEFFKLENEGLLPKGRQFIIVIKNSLAATVYLPY
jgi:hypothetical protein